MMNKAQAEAIADILKDERATTDAKLAELRALIESVNRAIPVITPAEKGDKGEDGKDGNGIQAVELHADYRAFDLIFDNGESATIELPDPKQGKDADPEQVAAILKGNTEFIAALKGAQGEPGAQGLQGERGERGERGEAGEDGLDAPVIDVIPCKANEHYLRGMVVKHRGGLWQATRKAYGTPDDDPMAYRCIVRGLDSMTLEYDDTLRELRLVVRDSEGGRVSQALPDVPRYADPDTDQQFKTGDLFIKDTTLLVYDQEWQARELRGPAGPEGPRGRKGMKGESAPRISDIDLDEETDLTFKLDDGSEFGVPLLHYIFNFVAENRKDLFEEILADQNRNVSGSILRYVGQWEQGASYQAGDVVTAVNALYLALNNTSADLGDSDWAAMVKSGGGSFGTTSPSNYTPITTLPGLIAADPHHATYGDDIADIAWASILGERHHYAGTFTNQGGSEYQPAIRVYGGMTDATAIDLSDPAVCDLVYGQVIHAAKTPSQIEALGNLKTGVDNAFFLTAFPVGAYRWGEIELTVNRRVNSMTTLECEIRYIQTDGNSCTVRIGLRFVDPTVMTAFQLLSASTSGTVEWYCYIEK